MDDMQVCGLADWLQGQEGGGKAEILHTHISWIILAGKSAYKIKKPLKLPFLDFSTMEAREFYCKKELELNSRLSDIYLEVLPVRENGDLILLGGDAGEAIDFAIKMKRLRLSRQMHHLMETGDVVKSDVIKLARKISGFHKKAPVIRKGFDAAIEEKKFADISHLLPFIEAELGMDASDLVKKSIDAWVDYIGSNTDYFKRRIEEGWVRDVHGDLHSGNIFLYSDPVIFDCIEFNDDYRQVDLISDIAFFCMDMERFGRDDYADLFLDEYQKKYPLVTSPIEEKLFLFYKLYRAAVRVKVHAIGGNQAENPAELQQISEEISNYLRLMRRYLEDLKVT